MAETRIRFKIAGYPAADWTTANPILLERELGIETDTYKVKLGDGATAWNSLDYALGDTPAFLLSIGALTLAAGDMIYATGPDDAAKFATTSYMRGLLNTADLTALLTALGISNHENRLDSIESYLADLATWRGTTDGTLANHETRISALEP